MKTRNAFFHKTSIAQTAAWLLAAAVLMGCSSPGESSRLQTTPEVTAYPMGNETGPTQESTVENGEAPETDTDETPAPDGNIPSGFEDIPPQSETELTGSVRTVGTDSLVISQSFEMGTTEGDGVTGDIMVAPAEGSPDEVLITVHVTHQTTYEIKTVRNGGVNGDSDVDVSAGSFSDIQTGLSLSFEGHYENGDFHADSVSIYRFL